jgi:hypothetical protein
VLYRCAVALALLGPVLSASAAEPEGTPDDVYPGITYTRWRDASGPVRLHVVAVDLSSAEVDLLATASGQRGTTPSAFAAAAGAVIAVNGDYFRPSDFTPAGLARGAAATWSGTRDDEVSGFVSFYKGVDGTRVSLSRPEDVIAGLEERVLGAVGGRPLLVQGGAPVARFACEDAVTLACDAAPRTAVAVSADGRTLWLVVVDGWQPDSVGMTAAQLARFLASDLGASSALQLDGGSASAMAVDGEVVSAPSDGVERAVANHLAVRYGTLPPGTVKGVVKERNVETGASIEGATVTLDDGRTATTEGEELWVFEVAPRWVCATATAEGYHPGTTCRQARSGEEVYASIALFPNSDFIDGGPGEADAGQEPADPDAGRRIDAGPAATSDAGTSPPGRRSDGCTATARGASGAPLLGLALLASLLWPRRARQAASRSR